MTNLSDPIYHDEDRAREHLENIRWPDGPYCPFCGVYDSVRALPKDGSMGPGWYHCKACRKKFTVRVGTVYERSKVPLHKWLLATHFLTASKKGMSAHQLHRMLGVTYKTAWFMAHRIREAMLDTDPDPMGGKGRVVEADETFIGKPDAQFVNGVGWVQMRGTATKRKVVSLVERGGRSRSFKVDNIDSKTIRKVLFENIVTDSDLHTDQAQHYKRPGREFNKHETVNHSENEYARGDVTTNTVEGFFGIFKRGMRGVYHHCGEQHLQRYLNEFDFRYSHRELTDDERAEEALKGISGKRLTYRRTNEAAQG